MNQKTRKAQSQRLPPWLTFDRSDRFTITSYSLMTSPAYQSLTPTQKELLHVAHGQHFWAGNNRPSAAELTFLSKDEVRECFFLNRAVAVKFGVYGEKSTKLSHDIKVLIDRGFIKQVANGKANFKRSVYTYSEEWKRWRP